MNIQFSVHHMLLIPVKSAAITISTCLAEQSDNFAGLKNWLQIYCHLVGLLKEDDIEQIINWYDGRLKSMLVSICTTNQAAIQYAFSQGLLDEEETIEDAVRGYLESQRLCPDSIEALLDEFLTSQIMLRQGENGILFVTFDGELIDQ